MNWTHLAEAEQQGLAYTSINIFQASNGVKVLTALINGEYIVEPSNG